MSGPRLIASECVSATMPPLDAEYANVSGSDMNARVDVMFVMLPLAAAQVRRRGARDEEHAGEVDVDHAAEVSHVGVFDRLASELRDPGVVDDGIEAAAPRRDRVDHARDCRGLGDVELVEAHRAEVRELVGGIFARRAIAIDDRDVRAIDEQPRRDRAPDAGSAARDDRDPHRLMMWIASPSAAADASMIDSDSVGCGWIVRRRSSHDRAHLDRERALGDQVARAVRDDVHAEQLARLGVRDDLREALGVVDRHRAAEARRTGTCRP